MKKIVSTTKFFLTRPTLWYRATSLKNKMLIGYIVVIVIPFIFFFTIVVKNLRTVIYNSYIENERYNLEQSYLNFHSNLTHLQGTKLIFENNKVATRYLSGNYESVSDEMYDFLVNVSPYFHYITAAYQGDIEKVTIYTPNEPLVRLADKIIYDPLSNIILQELPIEGRWVINIEKNQSEENLQDVLKLVYQSPIYLQTYYKRIAYIELMVSSKLLINNFSPAEEENIRYIFINENTYLIKNNELILITISDEHKNVIENMGQKPYSSDGNICVNQILLGDINSRVVSLYPKNIINESGIQIYIILMIVLFLVLSLFYYIAISSFGKRLLTFAKFIKKTDYDNLEPYKNEVYGDEIGEVITSYNDLLERINNLILDLNILELKKQEAKYHALQAQIRPHFLYNSLETARMIAEINDDDDVSEFLFNLGSFIRYSVSYKNEVTIEKEVDMVKKYLEIYKASMGERIDFEIVAEDSIKNVCCPSFIIQPFVENCIHHGIGSVNKPLFIEILIKELDEERILISIKDNGMGIKKEKLDIINNILDNNQKENNNLKQKRGGLGVVNTLVRIQDFYGKNSHIKFNSKVNIGTTCEIFIEKRR